MTHAVDLAVIVAYLVAIAVVGLKLSGRQRSATDWFTGERSLPWWAVMFSIVATETSTLTVISVPGVAYGGSFSYVELAVGYLIGRVLVAFVLLPLYFRRDVVSAYQYLGQRFGRPTQGLASLTFLVTRLLAEGVRLFAGAIPIKLLLAELGLDVNYVVIVLVITAVTVAYTYVGGMKAVVWTDFLQMGLYVVGAVICVVVLATQVGAAGWAAAWEAGKFTVFDFAKPVLTSPYAFVTAVVGGALLTMGSHGSDQLIAQRVLSCRSLSDGRRAMIGSAAAIGVQFALFSLVGALLWARNGGAPLSALHLTSDQVFGEFILRDLPTGLSGLLVAGILAATMGSLSAALNSLSTSTLTDLVTSWTR
ncbi:sodium:solute symporter [Actinomycetospora sp. TBRC 11914]|uniref:sodium:solute symporter n=1 Tax=Actinomycetospora sp. TBRC 11914 TaxID=2729387 RepID=UPI002899452F|nr:sodium:solute symporter [Actinomycetospora sp. TBRC 11914]